MAELTIEKSSERKSRMSGVLWGKAKCGKSTFLTSLPGKKLFVMIDPDGDQSLPDREDIFILNMYEHDDATIMRFLRDKLPTMLRKNEDGFSSVVIDSLSTLATIALNEAIRTGVGESNKFKPSLDAPGLTAYGSRTNNIIDIVNKNLRATASVGQHCWFTSHEDEPKTNDKGEFLYITMTQSGKAINGIGLNVSEIWHMTFHDKKWRIAVAPCRGKEPMGSRIFDVTGSPEFALKFDISKGADQPHSLSTWYDQWVKGGRQKLPLPT
jgi:hypothetical protein